MYITAIEKTNFENCRWMTLNFRWDKKKNRELADRGRPSFEDAVEALANNTILFDDINPRHQGQRIFVIEINGYPHVIPYEVRGEAYWLITVFPSRKFKR